MKKLNLSGVTNTLSEKEMKEVLGGAKADPPNNPLTIEEAACAGKSFGSGCSMEGSGFTVSGNCGRNIGTGNLECIANPIT